MPAFNAGSALALTCIALPALASVQQPTFDDSYFTKRIAGIDQLGTKSRLELLKSNMSVDESLKAMPPLPSALKAFIAKAFAGNKNINLLQMAGEGRVSKAHLRFNKTKVATKSVEEAREMLNEFIEETVERLDTEKIRCGSDLSNQHVLLVQVSQDLADYSSQAADADADILRAETNIEELRVTRESVEEELEEHNRICASRIQGFEDSIVIMTDDKEILDDIVAMTECSGEAESLFLQCSDTSNRSTVKFALQQLREKMHKLRSATIKHRLQATISELYRTGRIHAHKQSLVQRGSKHKHAKGGHLRRATSKKQQQEPFDELMEPGLEPEEESCTLASNPNCGKLLDKFMELAGAATSDLDTAKRDLEQEKTRCKDTADSMDAQIKDLEARSMDWETSLAEATSRETNAQQMMGEKNTEKTDLTNEFNDMSAECETNIETCESEMCALGKIRGELYKMSSTPPYIVDCQVSEWTAEDCSVSCGGGVHNFTRSVTMPPELGAACPPLELEQACNVQECPIDCDISEWSGWSACSAKCGGGVRERMRTIHEHARFGGVPCGGASEVQPCNMQSCDVDCVLSAWTKEYFAPCSKACDGGVKVLTRDVDIPAVGMGECPAADSPERYAESSCNQFACDPKEGATLKCDSKVDAILLLDGSGTVTEEGWTAMKDVAKSLVSAFNLGEEGASLAVMQFSSGPHGSYSKCIGKDLMPGQVVNMETECNMIWIQHFTTDSSATAGLIDSSPLAGKGALHHIALKQAEAELIYGREGVEKTIIMITDGVPGVTDAMKAVTKRLRNKAKLLFVPVTSTAKSDLWEGWASQPTSDNIVSVSDFDSLDTPETVNKIISDTCPSVV